MADLVYRTRDELEIERMQAVIADWRRRGNQHEVDVWTKKLAEFRVKFDQAWGAPKTTRRRRT